MAEEQSERKEFEASSRKLKKMREKGQFAQSRDVVTAITALISAIYLGVAAPLYFTTLVEIYEISFRSIAMAREIPLSEVLLYDLRTIVILSAPLHFIVFLSAAFATGLMGGGINFALDPLAPKFEKINPTSGFKRVFGKKALFQFLTAFIKVNVFVFVLACLLYLAIGEFTRLGRYLDNALELLIVLTVALVATLIAIMLVIAAIDFVIQRRLFLNEAKMTRTERKNEDKEQEGDPHMRSRRKEIGRENVTNPTGPALATFAVRHGNTIVAYLWIEGKTNVPILVAKSTTAAGARGIRSAMPRAAVVIQDELAPQLSKTLLGSPVLQKDIHALANLMSRHGLY